MPNGPSASPAAARTYVVVRYGRALWAEPPDDEVTPLGTVRARTPAEAKARARAAWPGEPATALRVRRASACRPALLVEALAADGARGRPHQAPGPDGSEHQW